MCVACRELKPRNELFRFVKCPRTGTISRNDRVQLSGKGLYVCRSLECWSRLLNRRNLKRSVGQRIDAEGIEWVESALGGKG